MGRDKGSICYHGVPQVVHAWRLLSDVCERAYVSASRRNAVLAPYADLPLVVDHREHRGPASGLEAAWALDANAAWLVLAVDMPFVDRPLLEALIAARASDAPATVFRHPDGTLEPLCAIWEPTACAPLREQLAGGDASLRHFLEQHTPRVVSPRDPGKLKGVNDFEGYSRIIQEVDAASRRSGF